MKLVILCFLLAGSALAEETADFIVANINDYVDNILPSIVNFIITSGMDPMAIPDLIDTFSVKPLLIEYHGELELTQGSLFNIRSLRRAGDTMVSYQNKLVKVKGDFGVHDLHFNYEYLAKIMDIGPTGGLKGSVSSISIVVEMLIDFNSNEIHLQQFYMHDVGSIDIKLTGNVIADFLANGIVKLVTSLFKNTIVNAVESNIRKALEDYLKGINSSASEVAKLLAQMQAANKY